LPPKKIFVNKSLELAEIPLKIRPFQYLPKNNVTFQKWVQKSGSCHKRQKPQAPTPQAPIRNRQTKKVANAKGLNRNTNLT